VKLLLHGANHESAPVEVRERLAVSDPRPLLEKLVRAPEVEEAILLSTCNRTEVVVATRALPSARLALQHFFRHELARAHADPAEPELDLEAHVYEHVDRDAMRHVLRVAASLDSMVLGEPQILGQTKDAYELAVEAGTCGPILSRLFQHAFATAKRVRNETAIAVRPISVARVAVDLARRIFERLADKRVLLIGAGEMMELALQALSAEGLGAIQVANRTPERAAQLALRFGASAHGLTELSALVSSADLVLSSIAGDRPLLTRRLVEDALRKRRDRPLFVIDLGVPRNVEPEIDELANVYRYDIDDLSSIASENAERRQSERARAEAIVAEEQQRFDGWFTALRAVPTIQHLRARSEEMRESEVERAIAKGLFHESQRDALEQLTRGLMNKFLHAPMSRLRRESEAEAGMAYLEAARALFGLDEENERVRARTGESEPAPLPRNRESEE
jgi:glutamyl-tRNA reductase